VSDFASLKIVGGLLSSDLLGRVFAGDTQVPGTTPESYDLERGESVRRQASRSWPYLLETWQDEKKRDRWNRILLRELGFHQFPDHVPVRILGWGTDLDRRTPHVHARAPQSVLQEQLNRDDARLWAILSNGTTLRLLRDSTVLVGSAYVEFDLEAIFSGELFSDFVLLYLVCHESRFAVQGDGGPESCYLEQWRGFAAEQGERALDQLRKGVEQAISTLGTGFLSHPGNPQLRHRLEKGELKLDDLNRALLRLVYRMLFWFVAEDRGALMIPDTDREARERYEEYFSSARLRRLARRHRGTRHGDLFDAVGLVFDGLGSEGGVRELALPGIGGVFETGPLDEPVAGARLSNEALLSAVRALSLVKSREGGPLRRVDFGNLGAEELGSVYESLLELIPHYDPDKRTYTLEVLPGNERKESGSYYTPSSLVECLLDSALDPLLDEACSRATAEEKVAALLDLTVCDPACGSGHFLVAAARRIAKRVATEETGEPEPPEAEIRKALRRVVGRCIYGVDINPMAAELAKVSLWLEALEPGKPLSYLDQNIRVGNSLLGVIPALLADGLPDTAFNPIEGDDRKVCAALKKQNAAERQGQHDLFSQSGIPVTNAVLAKRSAEIAHALPESLEDLHIHQQRQAEQLTASSERRAQKLLADAWCAAFVQRKTGVTRPIAVTHAVIESFADDDPTLDLAAAERLVAELTRQYRFFHWHIEFPHILRVGAGAPDLDPKTGWSGGFSCVIGNPPWEKVELKEQEFFAQHNPKIANAPNAATRKKLIAALPETDPVLYAEFTNEQRKSAGWTHLLKDTNRYPLTGQGRLNTYAVFAETARTVIAPVGRLGIIVPTGIATDATTASFFRDLVHQRRLDSLLDFVTNPDFWQEVGHGRMRFSLLTITGSSATVAQPEFATLTKHPSRLPPRGQRIHVPASDLLLVNPNTGTSPLFQTQRDADITLGIYRRIPVLWRDDPEENPWNLSFMQGLFNMASDSSLFRTTDEGDVLPLYEAKLIHQFDHRLSSYDKRPEGSQDTELPRLDLKEKNDPWRTPVPRYWVDKAEVDKRLARRNWDRGWLLGWRDICRTTDERTVISAVIPRSGVGDKYLLAFTDQGAHLLQANLSSFVLDYVARQKFAGTSLKYYLVKQLPVLPPTAYQDWAEWMGDRVLELTYTAWDVEPFAHDLGDDGPPFRWNEDRRFVMRAELDAAFFHLYGIERDDVDFIMETFPIVKRKDVQQYGTFRTKDQILEIYDAMAEAARTGKLYQTILDPAPGKGPRHG
jgi:hypothetical protein